MKIKKIMISILTAVICGGLLVGIYIIKAPKTLVDTDTLKIVCCGNKTAVYDVVAGKEYNFVIKKVRRIEGEKKPYTAVCTDTIKIDVLPNGVLKIIDETSKEIHTIQKMLKFEPKRKP